MEVLRWLRSEGCPWDKDTCYYAVLGGQLEVLKWLRSEGCPWDEGTCAATAESEKYNDLEILRWLRSEGCPWDEELCNLAARRGHLEMLRWAISNGCPYEVNEDTRPALRWLGFHIPTNIF